MVYLFYCVSLILIIDWLIFYSFGYFLYIYLNSII